MALSRVRTVVATNWLHDQIKKNVQKELSKKLRILDTSFLTDTSVDTYKESYMIGHIPQSLHFNLYQCVKSTPEILINLPDENCFTDYVQSLGVWSDTHVIAYDRYGPMSAYKTWWLFRTMGHRNISILDGGLRKWIEDGYEITDEEPEVKRGNFVAKLNKNYVKNCNDVIDIVTSNSAQIVDARPGVSEGPDGGAILGSKHVSFTDMFDDEWTLKSNKDLKKLFDAAGVDLRQPMVATCFRGLTAAGVVAAAHILGKEDVPVYVGAWSEFRHKGPDNLKKYK